jgi:hypothetical protein
MGGASIPRLANPARRGAPVTRPTVFSRSASFCTLHVEVRAEWLVSWHHVRPVLGVMAGVDEGEHGVVHVPGLRVTGNVDKLECREHY